MGAGEGLLGPGRPVRSGRPLCRGLSVRAPAKPMLGVTDNANIVMVMIVLFILVTSLHGRLGALAASRHVPQQNPAVFRY